MTINLILNLIQNCWYRVLNWFQVGHQTQWYWLFQPVWPGVPLFVWNGGRLMITQQHNLLWFGTPQTPNGPKSVDWIRNIALIDLTVKLSVHTTHIVQKTGSTITGWPLSHGVTLHSAIVNLGQAMRGNHCSWASALLPYREMPKLNSPQPGPTSSEWSTISLPTKMRLILEVWR